MVERLLLLGGAALVLLLGGGRRGELVARRLVRHLAAAAETADRLGEGDLDGAGARRGSRARYAAWAPRSTGSRAGSTSCWRRSARRWPTSRTGCGRR